MIPIPLTTQLAPILSFQRWIQTHRLEFMQNPMAGVQKFLHCQPQNCPHFMLRTVHSGETEAVPCVCQRAGSKLVGHLAHRIAPIPLIIQTPENNAPLNQGWNLCTDPKERAVQWIWNRWQRQQTRSGHECDPSMYWEPGNLGQGKQVHGFFKALQIFGDAFFSQKTWIHMGCRLPWDIPKSTQCLVLVLEAQNSLENLEAFIQHIYPMDLPLVVFSNIGLMVPPSSPSTWNKPNYRRARAEASQAKESGTIVGHRLNTSTLEKLWEMLTPLLNQ